MSDCEFDEHGIYREKPGSPSSDDHGILVDEDGIWREDMDSHFMFHTDSGFGTRKSSSSTLNRIPLGTDHHDLYRDIVGYRAHGHNDLGHGDDKSLNISEFEASESAAGEDFSYEDHSYSSEDNLDLPELHDESYMVDTSESMRNEQGLDGRSGSQIETDEYIGTAEASYHDVEYRDHSRRPNHPSKTKPADEDTSSLGYLLTSHRPEDENDILLPHGAKLTSPDGHPTILGDSIFSQQDEDKSVDPMALLNQGGSLIEFEQLEAALGDSHGSDENMDLIGAYLQDIKAQDEADEALHDEVAEADLPNCRSNNNQHLLLSRTGDNVTHSGFSGTDAYGSSIPFEESTIEDTLAFNDHSNLDMSIGDHKTDRPAPRSQTPTRIPMLRARSPSMSRPGSTSPTRQLTRLTRPASMEVVSPRRADQGRSLPRTPGQPASALSHLHQDNPSSLHSKAKSTNDLELDKAASLLVGGASEGNVQGRHSGAKKRFPHQHRSVTPNQLKMRGREQAAPASGRTKPVKATQDLVDLSRSIDENNDLTNVEKAQELTSLFQKEMQETKLDEATHKALQSEYNSLLKKYAQAENTIDELRLGARVSLYSDTPAPQMAHTGKLVPAQQPHTFSMVKSGSAMVGMIGGGAVGSAVLSHTTSANMGQGTSRPQSQTSYVSSSMFTPGDASGDGGTGPEPSIDETTSLVEDGIKLSLLAKAKDVDEQVSAFDTLLGEEHLSLEDQQQALTNIQTSLEHLQQEYRDARNEHEYLRRQGLISSPPGADGGGFDESKDVEGELYKLNMKLDDLQHCVQENLKVKTMRKPFKTGGTAPSPMTADHTINVRSNDRVLRENMSQEVGAPSGLGEKLSRVNQDYNDLMKEYKRLKQMEPTRERDRDIDTLLLNLQQMYGQSSDAEKSTYYPNTHDNHMEAGQTRRKPDRKSPHTQLLSDSKWRHKRAGEENVRRMSRGGVDRHGGGLGKHDMASSRPSRREVKGGGGLVDESDYSSAPDQEVSSSQSRLCSSDTTSGMRTDSRPSSGRIKPAKPLIHTTSDTLSGLHQASRRGRDRPGSRASSSSHRRLPKVVSRHKDKDSGYVGSEGGSLRNPRQTSSLSKPARHYKVPQGPHRSDARSPLTGHYSHSDSDSSADTVEENMPQVGHFSHQLTEQSDDEHDAATDGTGVTSRDKQRDRGRARYASESPSDEDVSNLDSDEDNHCVREQAAKRSHAEGVLPIKAKISSKPTSGATQEVIKPQPLLHNGQVIGQVLPNGQVIRQVLHNGQVIRQVPPNALSTALGQASGPGQSQGLSQIIGNGQIQGQVQSMGSNHVQGHNVVPVTGEVVGHRMGQDQYFPVHQVGGNHLGQYQGHSGQVHGYHGGQVQGPGGVQVQGLEPLAYQFGEDGGKIYHPDANKINHGGLYKPPAHHSQLNSRVGQPLSSVEHQQRSLSPPRYAETYREAKRKLNPSYSSQADHWHRSPGNKANGRDLDVMSDQETSGALRSTRHSRHPHHRYRDENSHPLAYDSDGGHASAVRYSSPQRGHHRVTSGLHSPRETPTYKTPVRNGYDGAHHHGWLASGGAPCQAPGVDPPPGLTHQSMAAYPPSYQYDNLTMGGQAPHPNQQYTPHPTYDNRHNFATGVNRNGSSGHPHYGHGHNSQRQVQSVPAHVQSVPAHVQSVPAHVQSVPAHVQSVPAHVQSVPGGQVPSISSQALSLDGRAAGSTQLGCPMCGGLSTHSHGEYVFQAAQQTTFANATLILPNTTQGIPVRVVSQLESQQPRAAKVRYYVKEYKDGGSQSEEDDAALNDSLNEALKEAKKIKKVTSNLKKKINDELNSSLKAQTSY